MTPNINKRGYSFLGAMRYYTHDKRPEGETGPHPTTSERVDWTDTRNLDGAAGPHSAARIMIDHAQQADELKRANGIKNTGTKSKAHVYTFSLSWREDEVDGLDRAEMLRATDAALKFLGADHLQAVIIAHNDTAHPHVHVLLNRVQADGRMWNPSHDMPKFQQWANRYEHENGKIVSPNRAEKWDKIEEGRAQHPDAEKRREHVADRKKSQADQARAKEPTRGQKLKAQGDELKARHKAEWQAWSASAKAGRATIYRQADTARRAAQEAFKAATKKDWAQHFRDERERTRAFEKRDQTLSGLFKNAFRAAKVQTSPQGGEGLFARAVRNVFSSAARQDGFKAFITTRADRFRAGMTEKREAATAGIETQKRAALIEHDKKLAAARAALIERQKIEQQAQRAAWTQFYAEKAAMTPGPSYRRRKAEPIRPRTDRPDPTRRDLKEARAAMLKVANANQYRAGADSRQSDTGEQTMRKDWKHLVEDRAIMSGAEPTNPENMRRREADAAATPTPGASFLDKYRRAAEQKATDGTPPRPTRKPRMKP